MKKLIVIIINLLLTSIATIAQENGNTRIETFDNNTFDWNEFDEKKKSVSIQDGYLFLECKKDDMSVETVARFPLRVRDNFKIIFKFLVPKLNDKNLFGIIFNWADENNYSAFLLKENYFSLVNRENESSYTDKKGKIKLKDGKDQTVIIELEKVGNKLIFNVNGMLAYEKNMTLKHPYFGFYSENKATIKVDEITIRQMTED